MGFVVNSHYCEGKLVDISIYQDAKKCCCDADEANSDCCKNESEVIVLEDEQSQIEENNRLIVDLSIDIQTAFNSKLSEQRIDQNGMGYTDEIPPPNIPIHILLCDFTLYG